MDADLDTLATELYARIDDTLKARRDLVPWRPKVGIAPKLSGAELLVLAVMQALLGFAHEARWLRHAKAHLTHLFPCLAGQSRYNKRLRRSTVQLQAMIRLLGEDTDVWADDTWLIDSTPVECSRSVPTTKRSRLAGWAGYGCCASHSRFYWGYGCTSCAPRPGCRPSASSSGYRRSPPPSGTTTTPANPSCDHSPPTTTETPWIFSSGALHLL